MILYSPTHACIICMNVSFTYIQHDVIISANSNHRMLCQDIYFQSQLFNAVTGQKLIHWKIMWIASLHSLSQ